MGDVDARIDARALTPAIGMQNAGLKAMLAVLRLSKEGDGGLATSDCP
ncbi:MAG: hypothetical protein RIC55_30280 [Pirellulaceae bacterium]